MFLLKGNDNRGFSLVELIIVVSIMAVLLVVLAPAMLRYVEKTRVQKDESAVAEVLKAAELALADDQLYTAAGGEDITVKVTDDAGISVTCGAGAAANAAPDLQRDIRSAVGEKIRFSSAHYRGKTFTLFFRYEEGRQAYVAQPDAANPSFQWTVS